MDGFDTVVAELRSNGAPVYERQRVRRCNARERLTKQTQQEQMRLIKQNEALEHVMSVWLICEAIVEPGRTMLSSDFSLVSSFFSSTFGTSAAPPPPSAIDATEAVTGASPPPMLIKISLVSLPCNEMMVERYEERRANRRTSSAFSNRDAQIGSISRSAAVVNAKILSDVMSILSSARMCAACVAASSCDFKDISRRKISREGYKERTRKLEL